MSVPIIQYKTTTANLALLAAGFHLNPGSLYFDTDEARWYLAISSSALKKVMFSDTGVFTADGSDFDISAETDGWGNFSIGQGGNRWASTWISSAQWLTLICASGDVAGTTMIDMDTNYINFQSDFAVFKDESAVEILRISLDGGITFPATQNANSDANTLDDYEEGDWTPDLLFGGNAVSMTYSTQDGAYIKIGGHVFVTGTIILTAKGSSTGAATIAGLPFTVKNDAGCSPVPSFRIANISFADFFQGRAAANSAIVTLEEVTNAGTATTITDADFADTSVIRFSLHYIVA